MAPGPENGNSRGRQQSAQLSLDSRAIEIASGANAKIDAHLDADHSWREQFQRHFDDKLDALRRHDDERSEKLRSFVDAKIESVHDRISADRTDRWNATRTIMWSSIGLLLTAVGVLSILAFRGPSP